MAFCTNCGKDNAEDAKFCAGCGGPMVATSAQSSGETAVTPQSRPRSGGVPVFGVITTVVTLLLTFVVVFKYYHRSPSITIDAGDPGFGASRGLQTSESDRYEEARRASARADISAFSSALSMY